MRAEKIDAWRIGDKLFTSRAKAQDHCEGELFAEIKRTLLPRNFSESECFKITEALLANRTRLSALLAFEIDDE